MQNALSYSMKKMYFEDMKKRCPHREVGQNLGAIQTESRRENIGNTRSTIYEMVCVRPAV